MMFEKELEEKFKRIFRVKKVTFDSPGESTEQGCIFVDIDNCKSSVKEGRTVAIISGSAFMYGPSIKIPFGFFSKAIAQADNEDTKDLFFSDIENNTQRFRDLVQRGFSFTYLFRGQYDPAIGTISDVNIILEGN